MIPRKYTSLNSPIMAINVITSCLSTVPSDCSSIINNMDNKWKIKGEIITETEISQLSTTIEKEFCSKEIELEYQDCSDDPSIFFRHSNIKSYVSSLVDSKKIKPPLPLYIFYAYPITTARIYKSFPKIIYNEVRYIKEQALWCPPNNNGIHSVVFMVSDIVGTKQKNYHLPIIENFDNTSNFNYNEKKCNIIVNEKLISSQVLENDIKCFSIEESVEKKKIEINQESNNNKEYVIDGKINEVKTNIKKNTSSFKGKYISKNFKGTMNVKDRIVTSKNSEISKYVTKPKKKHLNKMSFPLNVYFSKDNIQFDEYVNYDKLPEKVVKNTSTNFKTTIYVPEEQYETPTKSLTIVDTINEDEALKEGDINYSMISTEINNEELSSICDNTIQEVDCEKLTKQLNVINIENQYKSDSSKLISLPNTFSFLSKDFTTSSRTQTIINGNYTNTFLSDIFENNDENIIYEDMLQQLNSIKNVLNNFDTL